MNYQNIGAMKRHSLTLCHGTADQHVIHRSIPASDVLSRSELQELVAAMID